MARLTLARPQMILQMGVWGFLFPIGMVLGLSK